MIRIVFLLLCSILLPEIYARRHRCMDDNVLLAEKVSRSSFVVYGTSMSKQVHLHTKNESLFNVTFHVECIFKGQNMEKVIQITEAGNKIGKNACQILEPGPHYVIFLEKLENDSNSYRPVDFHEVLMDEMAYDLLEKTCHLMRIPPINSKSNQCPNVSIHEYCPQADVTKISNNENKNRVHTYEQSSYFNHNGKSNRQSHIIITKGASLPLDQEIHTKSNSYISKINWTLIVTCVLIMSIISYDFEMFNISHDYLYSY